MGPSTSVLPAARPALPLSVSPAVTRGGLAEPGLLSWAAAVGNPTRPPPRPSGRDQVGDRLLPHPALRPAAAARELCRERSRTGCVPASGRPQSPPPLHPPAAPAPLFPLPPPPGVAAPSLGPRLRFQSPGRPPSPALPSVNSLINFPVQPWSAVLIAAGNLIFLKWHHD